MLVDSNERQRPIHAAPAPAEQAERRVISSSDLLQGAVEVLIDHGGETYRLRQTRSGKLILQK